MAKSVRDDGDNLHHQQKLSPPIHRIHSHKSHQTHHRENSKVKIESELETKYSSKPPYGSPNMKQIGNKQFSWQDIQKFTFTGWCNAVLAEKNIQIHNLFDDLNDGTVLISIYQLLSGNPPPKFNTKPKIPQQIIENLDIVMKLFQQDGLATVNIGAMDIYEKNEKLILGFIWHLILYYQIGASMMVTPNKNNINNQILTGDISPIPNKKQPDTIPGDENSPKSTNSSLRKEMGRLSLDTNNSPSKSNVGKGVIRRASLRAKPQKLILDWVSSVLCEFTIKNLTTDWNDGILLGALVNRFDPNCCVNYKKWKKANAIKNVTEALNAAQTHIHIPTIIKPEHLASGEIDPQSFMTYISQFTKRNGIAFMSTYERLKKISPPVAKLVSSMDQQYWNDGVALASLVSVCCCGNMLQGGFYRQVNTYDGDKKSIETRSIYNIGSALVEAETYIHIQSTFTPDDLLHLKVHPLVFVTYINHLLNYIEFKEELEIEPPIKITDEVLDVGIISSRQYDQKSYPFIPILKNEPEDKHQNKTPSISTSQMFWVSNTEECYPGEDLTFEIKNLTKLNATFDDVHVEITYFRNDEEFKNKSQNQKSKVFIPFELNQIDADRVEGKFCAELHGIYRVQASVKGKVIQPVLLKRTSSSDEPITLEQTEINNYNYSVKFEPTDFECVFRDNYAVIDKDFVLTVYSSKHVNSEQFEFFFQSAEQPNHEVTTTLDHYDSLRYTYRAKFKTIGTYTLYVREKSKGTKFCYKNCVALVGDPSKITIISKNDVFVNPGEIIQIVCDVTDAGPGCLSAEVIYENKFFGYASVSSKSQGPRLHAIVTYIVPVIISGTFEFRLKWNDFSVDTANKTKVGYEKNTANSLQFISFDPSKAIVQGEGLNKIVPINCEQFFTVTVNNIKCVKRIEGYIKMIEDISNKKSRIELLPDNHNTYVGYYLLDRVGTYQLDLLINGRPVFEQPFYIESIDLSYIHVKIESEPQIINQPFVLKVYVHKKAGKGDLFYSLEGPNGPLKMSIEPLQTDNEKECFLLCSETNCPGSYTMDLTYGSHSITDFPRTFIVSNIEINKNTVRFDPTNKLAGLIEHTTAEFEFSVEGLNNQRDSKLLSGNVVQLDEYENITKLTPIDIKPTKKNGVFVSEFSVSSKNIKFLNLFFNKIPFPGNPYTLEVFKQNDFNLKVKNDIDQIFVNDLVTISLKTPIQFYEKQFNCSLTVNSNNETITIDKGRRVQTLSPCCEFEYTWTPTVATTYEISAYFNNILLSNTSTNLKVSNKLSTDLTKDHNVMFKTDDDIIILPTDQGKISPRIVMNERGNTLYFSGYMLSSSGNVKLPLKFQQESNFDGVKVVQAWYYHALPGVYSVWINYDNKPLEGGPFRVEVLETHLFSVAPDPNYQNKPLPCDQKYFFYVTIPTSSPLHHCILMIESPNGQSHYIRLFHESQEIASNDQTTRQFRVPFNEPSNGTHYVGLIYQTISIDSTFKHINIEMQSFDVSLIRVKVDRPENVLCNAPHELTIKTNGSQPQHDFLNFQGSIYADKAGSSGSYVQQPVTFTQHNKSTYKCQFYVNSSDVTHLKITCENHDLIGSPFELNVIDLSRATCVFSVFESSKLIHCDEECLLNAYIPYNSGEGQLRIHYTDPNNKIHEVPYEKRSISRVEEYHSYHAQFKPSIPGPYNLRVTYGGFDVSNSPYGFDVQPNTIPIDPIISGHTIGSPLPMTSTGNIVVGEEVDSPEFSVDLKDDQPYHTNESNSIPIYFMKKMNPTNIKNLSIVHIDPFNNETPLKLYKDVDYTGYYDKYYVDLVPQEEGLHKIQITNLSTDKTNTFEVQAKKHYANGLHCMNVPDMCCIGEKFTVDVIADSAIPAKSIRCRCIGPNNEASFISITTTTSAQYYQVHITPKCVGPHCLELEADKLPIRDSPYKVIVSEAELEDSVKVSGPGLSSSVLGDFIGEFEVDIVGKPEGTLEIQLTGPDKAYEFTSKVVRREKFMAASSSGKNKNIEIFTIRCNYSPLIPGIYIIEIFWKDVPLKKSPFTVYLCSNQNELDYFLDNN